MLECREMLSKGGKPARGAWLIASLVLALTVVGCDGSGTTGGRSGGQSGSIDWLGCGDTCNNLLTQCEGMEPEFITQAECDAFYTDCTAEYGDDVKPCAEAGVVMPPDASAGDSTD